MRETQLVVSTIIMHTSGEWISGELAMNPVKADPQGIGSAVTYARRYGLSAFVGIAPEDDDGNAASGNNGGSPSTGQQKRSFGSAAGNKPSADKPLVKANSAPSAVAVEDIGIESGQAAYLHRMFKDNVRGVRTDAEKEKLFDAWLVKKGFVDADLKASALKIPRDLFEEFKKEIREYAKGL